MYNKRFWNSTGLSKYPNGNFTNSYCPSGIAKEEYFECSKCRGIEWKLSFKCKNVRTSFPANYVKKFSITGKVYFCFIAQLLSGRRSTHRNFPFLFLTGTIRLLIFLKFSFDDLKIKVKSLRDKKSRPRIKCVDQRLLLKSYLKVDSS